MQTVGVHPDNGEPEDFTFVAKPLMTEQSGLLCSLVMFDTRMISGIISNSFSSCRDLLFIQLISILDEKF
jgi:hypothetical protein